MSELADSDARAKIRGDLGTTWVVEAAAGTGKTSELVGRILALVTSGLGSLSRIVAVTFTEKAAGEMKLRLRGEIEAARARATPIERARLDTALAELEAAHVSTIHGFCGDLLRERPIEARVDPLFEVAAEDEQLRLFEEAFDGWFERVLQDPPEGVARVLRRPLRERTGRGPRHALRGAGMTLIEQRDFDGRWRRDPFDRPKALDEVLDKLAVAAAFAGRASRKDDYLEKNIAKIARFLEENARREDLRREAGMVPRDYDRLEAELRALAGYETKWSWKGGGDLYAKGLSRRDVLRIRDEAKSALDGALSRCDADLAACLHQELKPLVLAYEKLKTAAGKLDFLDLLVETRNLLRDDATVRSELQTRFSHLLVDEFQDTDPLQAEILFLLAADDPNEADASVARPVPGKLFLVGDPKQSIYRFRRADVALYEMVKRRLVERGAEVLHLSTSFRGTPDIQRVVNAAFAPVMQGGEDGSQAHYVALSPARENPTSQPSVVALPIPRPYASYGKVTKKSIDESIPDAVCAYVDFLVHKSGWTVAERESGGARVPIAARHVCLLFKRFQSYGEDVTRPYVRGLEARGIPHVLVGGRSYHAREEVMALRNALFAIEWPDDSLSVYATLHGPLFALGDDVLLAYRDQTHSLHPMSPPSVVLSAPLLEVASALDILRDLHRGRNRRPIAETITRLLDATRAHAGFAIWPGGEQALANLLRMTDVARRFEASGATSFRAFVERIGGDVEGDGASEAPVVEEGTDGVRMMTVHKSKGLEFPVVILADPSAPASSDRPSRYIDVKKRIWAVPLAGSSPIELTENAEEVKKRDFDESMRVAYVAATRARDLLIVPVLGDPIDKPLDSWLDVLLPAIQPSPTERRDPRTAIGCPPFGPDSVLERPFDAHGSIDSSVAPGLHAAWAGGHDVVWWDPATLALGKEQGTGLRAEKLLVADSKGGLADDGASAHAAWTEARLWLLAHGSKPSFEIVLPTELLEAKPDAPAITREVVPDRKEDRPRGRRFGTLVHAILAEIALDAKPSAVALLATKQSRLLGASDEEKQAATIAAAAALAHPIMRRASAAQAHGRCRREVPIMMTTDDGMLEGIVDLTFAEDDPDGPVWTVVDYKTDAGFGYEAQVGAYVTAIAKATGERARGVVLAV